MRRRSFLSLCGTLVAGVVTGACNTRSERDPARPELLDVLGERAVRDIGRAYGASSGERDASTLRRLIGQSSVADDFAHDRVVVVNGWILARTEARQCALYDSLHA